MKGNVIDLAIAVIVGGAFGKIVTSLVKDIIMPLVGIITGGVDYSELSLQVGKASIMYGSFLQTIIDFLIISLSIFIAIKQLNRFKKKEEKKPKELPKPTKEQELLTEIRDLLKK
ncbi:MAG: large-conductance mechanosensitive channel protein MscL [Candidatus Pacebacteria bacterium]|nr:large-conductance mechanosensitive channel protein MscL [Candidatus Paceibacterota bacterium]